MSTPALVPASLADTVVERRVVLMVILVPFLIDLISSLLHRSWMSKPIPPELDGIYEETEYRKAQDYNKEKSTLSLLEQFYDMFLFQAFWWLSGVPALDAWVVTAGKGMIGSGLIYIFGLTLGKMILELPFSIYSTFWIEVKYGFNRTTPWTFVKDRLKGLGLMLALGVPLLALVLFFFPENRF